MHALLLLQAAAPSASAPAHEAGWVVIALAALTTIGNIVIAIVKRNSGARITAIEKLAKSTAARVNDLVAKLEGFDAKTGEYRVRIEELDERISSPEMSGRGQIENRLSALEKAAQAEREAREARRETQHKQELELAVQLTRMSENVKTLAHQVETLHANSSR